MPRTQAQRDAIAQAYLARGLRRERRVWRGKPGWPAIQSVTVFDLCRDGLMKKHQQLRRGDPRGDTKQYRYVTIGFAELTLAGIALALEMDPRPEQFEREQGERSDVADHGRGHLPEIPKSGVLR